MKAVICTKYGPPEVLQIQDVPKPIPKDNQILVKIVATAVNSGDVRVRALDVKGFMKTVMRLVLGFSKPRKPILGTVFAGIVEQTGKNVSSFKIADEVYGVTGFKFGTYAAYIAVSDKSVVVKKPTNATFEEAAAICFGGQTAYYFLEKANVSKKANSKILIYGATGAVGTAAIQIAKYHQAEVTAVCSEQGQEVVKDLGADKIILYNKEDFTKTAEKFDVIFDAVGKITKRQCGHLLNHGGIFKSVEGFDMASEDIKQLEFLRELFEKGKYKATIDKTYSINEIVAAHRYVDIGRKKGNVVIKIGE
ncbi:NAD(P)-dependent alcohol dehydrogenase [Aquiflexum sp. TKW24L]|uniref:NAD(P)-dependent alcohol dehydrogenase n=1 Tax=Aquiflexum sp. TKW24L TaxID=2942212 RepID=UPI0020C1403B|nr:NAD(P)-dependent alcohol dehydrogenase [Aquiflexum sp. TKW24L]MCL6258217.1 NAD(P)-dependent alcohol dehydrogenase [Aquiflexum sp. TKW24L]